VPVEVEHEEGFTQAPTNQLDPDPMQLRNANTNKHPDKPTIPGSSNAMQSIFDSISLYPRFNSKYYSIQKNAADSIQKIIQFNSQGLIDTG
jgi:hypothetical protein